MIVKIPTYDLKIGRRIHGGGGGNEGRRREENRRGKEDRRNGTRGRGTSRVFIYFKTSMYDKMQALRSTELALCRGDGTSCMAVSENVFPMQ